MRDFTRCSTFRTADELRRAAEKSEADRVAWRAVAADLEALWREVGGPSV